MKATFDDVYETIGKPEEFLKQTSINESLRLKLPGPVYTSWQPSRRTPNSPLLKNVSTFDLLLRTISIVNAYMVVTVRQVYYILVSSQDIYNNLNEYRRIVRILKRARLAGLISFNKVIDDTRKAEKTPSWDSIEDILLAAVNQYRSNWWRDQEFYVEVWLEKRALRRIFYTITNSYDVNLCTGGGYQSWSQVYQAKSRFRANKDKKQILLYFGDLDPSGKDMPRDIRNRLAKLGLDVQVIEVALSREDISEYRLPRNPTKSKDSRKNWYIEKYEINYAVELDALPPKILEKKIRNSVESYCDTALLQKNTAEDYLYKDLWKKRFEFFRKNDG